MYHPSEMGGKWIKPDLDPREDLILMSPKDFLDKAGYGGAYDLIVEFKKMKLAWFSQESFDWHVEAFKEELRLPIPTLFVNEDKRVKDCESHEGRHRAMAAIESGIRVIPVKIKYPRYVRDDIAVDKQMEPAKYEFEIDKPLKRCFI